MNKHLINLAESGVKIENDLNIKSTKHLTSLSEYHHAGGEFVESLPLYLERNARTAHIEAKLKSWVIGSVKMDITGYGKYSESYIIAEVNGVDQKWPFSMAYLRQE